MSSPSGIILQVGTDAEVQSSLLLAFEQSEHSVEVAPDVEWALWRLSEQPRPIASVVIAAVAAELSSLETLRQIRKLDPEMPVIFTAKEPSPSLVAAAIQNGATDFLQQPVSGDGWRGALTPASGRGQRKESVSSQSRPAASMSPMLAIEAVLELVGMSDAPVLIQGETGAGKEVLARKVHAASPRSRKPFVKLNCAALPSELVESELFGYERGAFTGAYQRKPGIFEAAQGGTILLDEIGDMDVRLQAKLLQVLQDHEFQRIGGKETIRVDVRVIAATHRDLERAIEAGQFREDLYYRLNVVNLAVPPLRERKEDILGMAEFLLRKHGSGNGSLPAVSSSLKDAILQYPWPGNIRELENVIRKLLIFRDPDAIAAELTSKRCRRALTAAAHPGRTPQSAAPAETGPMLEQLTRANLRAEMDVILAALNSTRWNRKRAAALLKVDYKALLYKMKKLGIEGAGEGPAAEFSQDVN